MAITSFREQFITWGMVGVLVFSTLSFIIIFQQENTVTNTILQDDLINKSFSNLSTTLGDFRGTAQTQRENYEADIPERGFGSLLIFAIVGAGQKFMEMIISTYNILIKIPAVVLGIDPIVVSVISAIVIVTLVILSWRVYRQGS